ncbi:hypothetical protein FU659_30890 [Paenibacillus sp. N3.4]|nr:hypothetical protein FU659_30890 [Paenibacillus sp. N3.4]
MSLDKNDIKIISDNKNSVLVINVDSNNIYVNCYLIKNDIVVAKTLFPNVTTDIRENISPIEWQFSRKKDLYSILIIQLNDKNIISLNINSIPQSEIFSFEFKDRVYYYSFSEYIDNPIQIEGLSVDQNIIYRNF